MDIGDIKGKISFEYPREFVKEVVERSALPLRWGQLAVHEKSHLLTTASRRKIIPRSDVFIKHVKREVHALVLEVVQRDVQQHPEARFEIVMNFVTFRGITEQGA